MNNELNNQNNNQFNNNFNNQNINGSNQMNQGYNNIQPQSNNFQDQINDMLYVQEPTQPTSKNFVSFILALLNYFVAFKVVIGIVFLSFLSSSSSFELIVKFIFFILYIIFTYVWIFVSGWKVCKYKLITKIIYFICLSIFLIILGKSIYDVAIERMDSGTIPTNTINEKIESRSKKNSYLTDLKRYTQIAQQQVIADSITESKARCYISKGVSVSQDFTNECIYLDVTDKNESSRFVILFNNKLKITDIVSNNDDYFFELHGEDIKIEEIDETNLKTNSNKTFSISKDNLGNYVININ